jgi:hypothetical protein
MKCKIIGKIKLEQAILSLFQFTMMNPNLSGAISACSYFLSYKLPTLI